MQAGEQKLSFKEKKTVVTTADDDWLRDAKITLTNTSDNTLNAIHVEIRYYPGNNKKPVAITEIALGSETTFPGVQPDTWITPGQAVDIEIPKPKFEILRRAIAAARASNISRGSIDIRIVQVLFNRLPDIMWRRGYWLKRDPANPLRFIRTNNVSKATNDPPVVKIDRVSFFIKNRTAPRFKASLTSVRQCCEFVGAMY